MPTIADPSAAIQQLTTVIERAASDPAYRSALIQSTTATLQSSGISIPAGLEVRVAENTDKIRNLVLFAKPSLSSGDAKQLEAMLSQASSPKDALDAYAKLTLDSWNDSQLRTRLQTNAASVLAQYGLSLPTGISIEQLEASDSLAWLTLSPAMASNITANFANLAKLITAGSYVAGLGFSIGAVMKFKQHKDNPTQIPIGTPIALLFIAAALIFLPAISPE